MTAQVMDVNRYANYKVGSKGMLYKQIKPPLVVEHAYPLTGFVCELAHVTKPFIRMKEDGQYCTVSSTYSSSVALYKWQ